MYKRQDIGLSSRHLGLVMPDELSDIKKQLNETADRLKKTIDMDLFIDIACLLYTSMEGLSWR